MSSSKLGLSSLLSFRDRVLADKKQIYEDKVPVKDLF